MYLLSGAHFFNPPDVDEADDTYLARVLISQCGYFGPFPEKFAEIANPYVMAQLQTVAQVVEGIGGRTPYLRNLATEFNEEDLSFLRDVMKPDPRDRLSVKKLLQHPWFKGVCI